MRRNDMMRGAAALAMLAPAGAVAHAQGSADGQAVQDGAAAQAPPFDSSRFLLGDWGGSRAALADQGITFDYQWTQHAQGVVSGGRDIGWAYGGTVDLLTSFDLGKMQVMPGAFVRLFAESRYGESVNGDAATILPVNSDLFFPLTDELDEDIAITITELSLTQFFSQQFGVTVGKVQTLDGDPNEFASGRGRSQFMNFSFVAPNLAGLAVPYSTLGAGVVYAPKPNVLISSMLANTTDASTTTGFGDIGDGTSWLTEARLQYRLGDLPGGQNLGFAYAFDSEFRNVNRPGLPGGEQGPNFEDESWTLYWSAWQYLHTLDEPPSLINPGDGRPDVRGLGLFARASIVDDDTNISEWGASIGVGGRGLIGGREEDSFGVGLAYTDLNDDIPLLSALVLEDDAFGVEAFYTFALAPGVDLTADIQILESALQSSDTTIVLGARLNIRF